MLPNEKSNGEKLGQEQASGFVTWQFYTEYLLKVNSAGTLSASRIIPPVANRCQEIQRQVHNRRQKEHKNSQAAALITLYNTLSISFQCGQCCGEAELIVYKKVFYCCFIKAETFSRIETCFPLLFIASNQECVTYLFNAICCT